MMMSASRKRKSKWIKWLSYVGLLLTGGGVGGWQLSESEVLLRLLGFAETKAGRMDHGSLSEGVIAAIDQLDPYRKEGVYEVSLDRVTLDPRDFKDGQTMDIQARVLKVGPEGTKSVVWDSRRWGNRLAVVGRDDLTAGWPDRPFRLTWAAGDRYLLEIWNTKGLRATRLFVLDRVGDTDAFPLRPGSVAMGLHADGSPVRDPKANTITLAAQRTGELPGRGRPGGDERGRSQPDEASGELAERPLVIR
jgi:hypothetical protein